MIPNNSVTRIGDLDIACLHRKSGADCVLFIHGLGCSKESFRDAFDFHWPDDSLSLLAFDLVGHGNSSKPADYTYTLEQQAEIVTNLLRDLAVGNVHIVAHSMGGAIALLAMRSLTSVKSFFCLEGNLIAEDCTLSKRVAAVTEGKFVNEIYPLAPHQFRPRGLPDELAPAPAAIYRSAKSLVYWSCEGNLLEEFVRLPVPRYYVHGERNKNIPVLGRLAGVEAIPIPTSGHFMMTDNPGATYGAIRDRIPS
jgi:pimeloyl-ACP methyl ester carboxylesterase